MALATKCPHCHTVFRVALDQLKLRGGIVRCGACNEIFDGNAALVAPSASVAGAAIPVLMPATAMPAGLDLELDLDEVLLAQAAPRPAAKDDSAPPERPPAPSPDADPADPDSEAAGMPSAVAQAGDSAVDAPAMPPAPGAGIDDDAPEPGEPGAAPEPEPSPLAPDRRAPAGDLPSEHIVAAALDARRHADDAEPAIPLLLLRRSAPADDAEDGTGRAAAAAPAAAPAAARDEPDEPDDRPEFVRQADRRERTQGIARLAMIAGIPLLTFVLLAQGVHSLRNSLAASYPAMKPALQALCAPLGCTVGLPRQIDALAIEQGELQTLAPDTFSFVTVLRNGSRSVQAWPHIELVLSDAADKPVLRRVFAPRDYLPVPADVARGFGPRSEQPVKLYFRLERLRASGYHIAIFHP